MARRTRVRTERPPHDEDSDDGYEQETPRQNKIRKRLSESNNPDASFGADSEQGSGSGRPPLHAVNINDDAAEKRRRRRSNRNLLDTSQPGPSSDVNIESETGELSRSRNQRPLNSVIPPPEIAVPLAEMASNYEEWMKMATDNKITATNTWDFALIDYFHDMQLLRNVDDNSINFQRASCTLDGCVKIWTSRVDSVGAETGKLLSNLANDMQEEEEEDSDNPDAGPSEKKKRRAHRGGSTLVKDPAQLRSKKMDLEFSVDPLFRKTCADFDEGGASGLLMNHLSLGIGEEGGLRVIFDASDSTGDKDDFEDEPHQEMPMDLGYLRETFLPDLGALDNLEIAPSLADFAFDKTIVPDESSRRYQDDTHVNLDGFNEDGDSFHGGDGGMTMDVDGMDPLGPSTAEDFFHDQPLEDNNYGGGGGYYGGGEEDGSLGPEEQGERGGPEEPFDPSRKPSERDLVMALANPDADGGMLEYFDKNFLKNWAGPEHWKIRRPIRKADTATEKPKAKREKKEAFKIDFLTPPTKSLKEITEELFKPGKASINLAGTGPKSKKSKEKEVKNDYRLPDDMHFTSRQLVTLFLKPKFALKMRGRTVAYNENGDGEVDRQFWAQNAADQAAGRSGGEPEENDPVPFNTQFFNDDDDLPGGFDDGFDAEILTSVPTNEEQDLLAATQAQSRRAKPETVKYTKRAKRVDVRKLKENIWRGLQIVVPDNQDADDSMDVDGDEPKPTDPEEARVFSSVIDDLQDAYPPEKMNDISTSFCFICLLHLANEQGLKLEGEEVTASVDQEEDTKVEREVGNLMNVKVYRDPEVGKIV